MEVAKITSKGQITIPISIRRKLELNEGDKVLFIYKPEGVMMVNPNNMQGGADGDVIEAAETEIAAEAVAAMKERSAAQPTKPAVAAVTQDSSAEETTPPPVVQSFDEIEAPSPQETLPPPPPPRPVPPPVEEPPAAPAKQVGGLDLGSLLDDIRSIGSNI